MSSVRALFIAVAAVSIAACSGSEPAPPASSVPAEAVQAARAPAPTPSSPAEMRADLPPLPLTPAARPLEVVRAVFTFAADHPEVLSKMPCFCGCENRGHKHNDDCFVTARDARGRVTAWEPHGVG
jgi:hypothetical protein